MPVVIRRARTEDARTIAEFALELVAQHEAYDPERFACLSSLDGAEWFYGSQTKADDSAVLVAEIEGRIIGFAYAQYEERNYASLLESAAWLHDIYVDRQYRGSDAGKSLIDAVIEVAKDLGANKLVLSVAAQNTVAREFFERSGFKNTMIEMMLSLPD